MMLVGKKYILIKIQTMRKNEIEDLLLSEMEEVNGGSGSSTCVCDNGGAGETIIVSPSVPDESEKGWVEC